MSDLDAILTAVLSGQDVTHIGQEYRSRTRMVMVDPGYPGIDPNFTEWPRTKSQEAIHSVMMDRWPADPDKSARVRAAIEAAVDKLGNFPDWPKPCRGYE